jgi:mono/diheme cytochrome c family protein
MSATFRIASVGLISFLVAMACGAPIGANGNFIGGDGPDDGGTWAGGGNTGGGTGGGAGGTGGSSGGLAGLPCDVSALFQTSCVSCHYAGNTQNIPPLASRDELAATSPLGGTYAARALTRIQAGTMPPGGTVPAAEVTALSNWINGGLQAGSCGTAIDAGAPTPVCTSGLTGSTNPGSSMNPGMACISCHYSSGDGPIDSFMGTAFPGLHEKDLCKDPVPTGTTVQVEILDQAGNSVSPRCLITVRTSSGNFMGNCATAVSPYRARVIKNGVAGAAMVTPQTDGDCNTCHTVMGANGAPGRIAY